MEEKRIDGKTLKEWIAERLNDETILVPRIQGDGQKLVMLYMIATPSYEWLLQIDSQQELTAEYAEKLLDIVEEQYGTYPEHGIVTKEEYDDAKARGEIWADCYEDFEEYDYRCNFPVPNINCGYGWDEIINFGKE
jgi:hypothetical protein